MVYIECLAWLCCYYGQCCLVLFSGSLCGLSILPGSAVTTWYCYYTHICTPAVLCAQEKSYAFVEFRNVEEASNLMAFDGLIFRNCYLRVCMIDAPCISSSSLCHVCRSHHIKWSIHSRLNIRVLAEENVTAHVLYLHRSSRLLHWMYYRHHWVPQISVWYSSATS